MESKIRVDYVGSGSYAFAPVLKIHVIQTEDARDKLLKSFFEQLGKESNLLKVEFLDNGQHVIVPVLPTELKALANEILSR